MAEETQVTVHSVEEALTLIQNAISTTLQHQNRKGLLRSLLRISLDIKDIDIRVDVDVNINSPAPDASTDTSN